MGLRLVRFVLLLGIAALCFAPVDALGSYPEVTVKGEKWTPSTAVKVYRGEELYRYIDGGAEVYIRAGLVDATVIKYQAGGHKEPVVVEIYRMKDSEGAQKVYAKHFSKGDPVLSLGDEAHYARNILTYRKGESYVRIFTFESLPDARSVLLAIARKVGTVNQFSGKKQGQLTDIYNLITTMANSFGSGFPKYFNDKGIERSRGQEIEGIKETSLTRPLDPYDNKDC